MWKKNWDPAVCSCRRSKAPACTVCVLDVGLCSEMRTLLKRSAESCVEGFCLACVYTLAWHWKVQNWYWKWAQDMGRHCVLCCRVCLQWNEHRTWADTVYCAAGCVCNETSARHGQTLCTVLQGVSAVKQHAVVSFTTTTDVATTCQHVLCTVNWSSSIVTLASVYLRSHFHPCVTSYYFCHICCSLCMYKTCRCTVYGVMCHSGLSDNNNNNNNNMNIFYVQMHT